MLAKALTLSIAMVAVLGLSACGEKKGKNGENGKETGIHITFIKETDVATCKEGRGGIRIETFYDTNGNDTKDGDEPIIEDGGFIECYKKTYK